MGCFKIFNIYPPFLKTEIFNLAEMSFFERKLLITFFFPPTALIRINNYS